MKNWETDFKSKAKHSAPLLQDNSSWNESRRVKGLVVSGGNEVRGYANVILCIEKGLGSNDKFLVDILTIIQKIQREVRQFNFHLASFEFDNPDFEHLNKPLKIDSFFPVNRIRRKLSEFAGVTFPSSGNSLSKPHIQIKNRISNSRYQPTKSDLLIFICDSKDSLKIEGELKKQLTALKRNVYWLYANEGDVEFETHIELIKRFRETNISHLPTNHQRGSTQMKASLEELLVELESSYEKSDIKKYCDNNREEWNYSLIVTNLEMRGLLIIGFNWGAAINERYSPETTIEKKDLESEDLGSLSRILPYCRKYFDDDILTRISQTNFCFFRSKKAEQISAYDLKLCEPIFDKLLAIVQPSIIICLSSRLRDHLINNDLIRSKQSHVIEFYRGDRLIKYEAVKGLFKNDKKIYFLPHPNYPMKKEAREKAWRYCFEDLII